MPSIYDIDFQKFAGQMLPPDKRTVVLPAWVKALLLPLQWIRDLWFGEYRTGTTAPPYAAGTYNKYQRVLYNKVVYESLIDANTDAPTSASWFIVQANFIGLSERILYNGGSITLTYALNKWFGTVFRQPPVLSDIYISTNVIVAPIFRIGMTEDVSSSISTLGSSEFIGISDGITTQINLSIFVPVAVYNALDVSMINNDKIFRNFADRYIPAGIVYQITTY